MKRWRSGLFSPRRRRGVARRRRLAQIAVGLAGAALLAAACSGPGDDDASDGGPGGRGTEASVDGGPQEWTRVACGASLPGPGPLATGEDAPGYFDEVAALGPLELPAPVDIAHLTAEQRTLVSFMLLRPEGDTVSQADVDAAGPLGQAVAAAIAKAGGHDVDLPLLRRGLYHLYACSRPLPPTLDDLRVHFGDYTTWSEQTVHCSRAKAAERRLYRRADGEVSVAETLDDDGAVRETEVIFKGLRDDGHVDFAAYTPLGALTNRSTFATPVSEVILASPTHCTSCHVDPVAQRMALVDATGTGAGTCP